MRELRKLPPVARTTSTTNKPKRMNHNPVPYRLTDRILGLIHLIRPRQWVKNAFVLAPLLFSGQFLEANAITQTLFATLLFCLTSSATYVVNDWHDIERDRQHPSKRLSRPLASGVVSKPMAAGLLVLLYCSIAAACYTHPQLAPVIAAYLALNLTYTFKLKHEPVIDIFCIALGFVLRVYAGAAALDVPVSSWMFITTLCLALYLAAVKRHQELARNGSKGRKVLEKYSVTLANRYAEMSATSTLVFYSLFVMSSKQQLALTLPFVLYGLFRYWYVVDQKAGGESPTDALLQDRQLQLTILAWIGVCIWKLWPY